MKSRQRILNRKRSILRLAICLVAGLVAGSVCAAERFVLSVPGRNDLTSRATVDARQLSITDWNGVTHTYRRAAQFDSRDGSYLGFHSAGAGRTIRWPSNSAGSMQILQGRGWETSRQQIQAVGGGVRDPRVVQQPRLPGAGLPGVGNPRNPLPGQLPYETRRPNVGGLPLPPADPRAGQNALNAVGNNVQPVNFVAPPIAFHQRSRDLLDVGFVDGRGQLQMYGGFRDQWQPHAVRLQQPLPPAAPLTLLPRTGNTLPSAFAVGTNGAIVEVVDGARLRNVTTNGLFPAAAHLSAGLLNNGYAGFAVDQRGQLQQIDFATGGLSNISAGAAALAPGCPLSYVSSQQAEVPSALFAVDRRGQLIHWAGSGNRWLAPRVLGRGFPPGAPLASAFLAGTGPGGAAGLAVGAVDLNGRLQVMQWQNQRWNQFSPAGLQLAPHAPVNLWNNAGTLGISAIDPQGTWQLWQPGQQGYGGPWNANPIAPGFAPGGYAVMDPFTQSGFSVDFGGRLVTTGYWNNDWHSHVCLPGFDLAPRLVSRRVVRNRGIDSARVLLSNGSRETVKLQMLDSFDPRGPQEIRIQPGQVVPYEFKSGGGGTIEEVYAVAGPRGWVEHVETYTLPEPTRYTAVVWADRLLYSYVDPKGISQLPEFDIKTPASIGVFDFPPTEFLRPNEVIDVYAFAAEQRNPGAVRGFPLPSDPVQVIPRGPAGRNAVPPLQPVPQGPTPVEPQPEPPPIPPLPSQDQPANPATGQGPLLPTLPPLPN